jgi:hypothetical protein
MKALPLLMNDSPMCRLIEIELPAFQRMFFNEIYDSYSPRVRRRAVAVIRHAKRCQGHPEKIDLTA